MRDGSIERTLRIWSVWDAAQARYAASVIAAPLSPVAPRSSESGIRSYAPSLLRAAGITLVLSILAMVLAVALGAAIAAGHGYWPRCGQAVPFVFVRWV